MEKMICSCCGAAIVPTIAQAFLTCEYCDTSVPNPYYDESAAEEAAKPTLEATCVAELLEMGAAQNLAKLDPDCFGSPINGIDIARAGLSISDADQVYFLYAHTILLLGFSDGLALTDSGLYYKSSGEAGRLPWDTFVTGAIACVDRTDAQNGTLKIGSAIEIEVKSEKDSRLARFLVDFHNHVYHLHTGETAPTAWCVAEPAVSAVEEQDTSLLGGLLPGLGALLGTSSARRKTIIQRTPTMHPTSRPTMPQDRRNHVQPPRPLQTQPHHRSAPKAPTARPGIQHRPGMGGPGGQRGPGGPGHSGRPGAMGGQRGPGGRGRR